MGVAASNRGTRSIVRQLDEELPGLLETLYSDLTAFSAENNGAVCFRPTVVRFGPASGEFSLMSRPDRGFGEFSYSYASLWSLFKAWRLAIVGSGSDLHGRFLRVVPLAKAKTAGA